MKEKLEKIKEHVNEYKLVYSCVVSSIVTAGITMVVMKGRKVEIRGVSTSEIQGVSDEFGKIQIRPFNFLTNNSGNVIATVHKENRGHPGFPVLHEESNTVYANQNVTANAFGYSPSLLSGHLNGKFPDIDGNHFRRLDVVAI